MKSRNIPPMGCHVKSQKVNRNIPPMGCQVKSRRVTWNIPPMGCQVKTQKVTRNIPPMGCQVKSRKVTRNIPPMGCQVKIYSSRRSQQLQSSGTLNQRSHLPTTFIGTCRGEECFKLAAHPSSSRSSVQHKCVFRDALCLRHGWLFLWISIGSSVIHYV